MASYIFRNRDKRKLTENDHFHSRTHLIGVEVRVRATACKSFRWKLYLDILMSRTVSVVFMFVLFRFVTKDLFSHFAWTSCLSFVACRASKAFSCSYATLMSFCTYQCNRPSWWWCCLLIMMDVVKGRRWSPGSLRQASSEQAAAKKRLLHQHQEFQIIINLL